MPRTIKQETINQTTKRHEVHIDIVNPIGNPVYVDFGFTLRTTDDADGSLIKETEVGMAVSGADFNSFMTYPIENGGDLLQKLSKAAQDARDALEAGSIEAHVPPA